MFRFQSAALITRRSGDWLPIALPFWALLVFAILLLTGQSAFAAHGLAVLPNGQAAGWGDNEFGQVDAGKGDFVARPLTIKNFGVRLVAIAAGARHSLAIDETGRVWAWGDNSSGQLGTGHTKPVVAPVQVPGLPGRAVLVSAGQQHSAALLSNGTIWVWGTNNRGQLGTGKVSAFGLPSLPIAVAGIPFVTGMAAGDDFIVVLASRQEKKQAAAGDLWVWGSGEAKPYKLPEVSNATVVRAAGDTAMARTLTNGYWRWQPGKKLPLAMGQRHTFDQLGVPDHPLLAALAVPSNPASRTATAQVAHAAASPVPQAVVSPAEGVRPVAAAPAVPSVLAPPVSGPAAITAAVAAGPASSASTAPTQVAAAPVPAVPAVIEGPVPVPVTPKVTITGSVHLSSGFGSVAGSAGGAPLGNAQVRAEGGQCSATDGQGRYTCLVPSGWNGRVSVSRNSYRFSPSSLSFQNLRADAAQQDFAAIFDPR